MRSRLLFTTWESLPQIEGEIDILTTKGTCFTITFSELDYCDRL